jgi:hypothetical protein
MGWPGIQDVTRKIGIKMLIGAEKEWGVPMCRGTDSKDCTV